MGHDDVVGGVVLVILDLDESGTHEGADRRTVGHLYASAEDGAGVVGPPPRHSGGDETRGQTPSPVCPGNHDGECIAPATVRLEAHKADIRSVWQLPDEQEPIGLLLHPTKPGDVVSPWDVIRREAVAPDCGVVRPVPHEADVRSAGYTHPKGFAVIGTPTMRPSHLADPSPCSAIVWLSP